MLDKKYIGVAAHLYDKRMFMHGLETEWLKRRISGYGLDVCCGNRKIAEVGVDINEKSQADKVFDVNQGLPFKDGMFDYVVSAHGLEHFKDPRKVFDEMCRVSSNWVGVVCPDPVFEVLDMKGTTDEHMSFPGRDDVLMWMHDNSLFIQDLIYFFNADFGIIGSKKLKEMLK